jgi:hypothetical protein
MKQLSKQNNPSFSMKMLRCMAMSLTAGLLIAFSLFLLALWAIYK